MSPLGRRCVILAGGMLLAACYRITVTSQATPARTALEKPWQHAFILGLVPPDEINVKEQCPDGVSQVEIVHSAPNVLATVALFGIYSPISARITCALR